MASVIDVCNLALSNIGDEAEVIAITPPDGSIQAAHCGRFYPVARDQMLEMHPWTFATVRVSLALVAAAAPSEWSFAYALPAKCLKPRAVYRPDALEDGRGEDFIVEVNPDGDSVVYTNVENAVLRYTRLVEDPTKFTPGFVIALARLMSSMLAGPILKGTTGIQVSQAQLKWFGLELASAKAMDSNTGQRSTYSRRIPDIQRARGGPFVDRPWDGDWNA
ncbi:hypothetical protein [Variovorax sp. GT1P44]|uniref:hypothetical protein n=1 Tax=Variovorax sp. GT1P44 TaxID=3443742 RepID=UPI003F4892C9